MWIIIMHTLHISIFVSGNIEIDSQQGKNVKNIQDAPVLSLRSLPPLENRSFPVYNCVWCSVVGLGVDKRSDVQ